jgi:thiol-disulfide isomerase/thioredoxin
MKKHLPLIVKILISALFLLSAIAKLFPVWAFEKQLVDLGIVDWCKAPYLSRLIIACEGAIAIAILQKNYLKSIVIPFTILLLIAFCSHLSIQMYQHGAMNGNCGCFGQLIPMTPLEAFIKNIITIILLVYLYRNSSDKGNGEDRFMVLLFIYCVSALVLFFFFPFCPCKDEPASTVSINNPVTINDSANSPKDTVGFDTTHSIKKTINDTVSRGLNSSVLITDTIKKSVGPAKAISKFSGYNNFNGTKIDLDEGKKIVCLFVPGCDHCREAAKEIVALKRSGKLPPVYVLFMNEEVYKIPEFFNEVKSSFPYFVIEDIPTFFKLLGNKATTPGVVYLWNGNIIKSYEGLEANKFNGKDMMQAIQSDKMN